MNFRTASEVLKTSQLFQLQREEIVTWIDVHDDYLDSCTFAVEDSALFQGFINFPTARHYGRAGIALFDGHVELHRWEDSGTRIPVTGAWNTGFTPETGRSKDWLWMRMRMIRTKTDKW